MDAAAKFYQFSGSERAGDGDRMKRKGWRDVGMPGNVSLRAYLVRRGVERLVFIAIRLAGDPAVFRGGACHVMGAVGHLITRQSGEPQKRLSWWTQGMGRLDGNHRRRPTTLIRSLRGGFFQGRGPMDRGGGGGNHVCSSTPSIFSCELMLSYLILGKELTILPKVAIAAGYAIVHVLRNA